MCPQAQEGNDGLQVRPPVAGSSVSDRIKALITPETLFRDAHEYRARLRTDAERSAPVDQVRSVIFALANGASEPVVDFQVEGSRVRVAVALKNQNLVVDTVAAHAKEMGFEIGDFPRLLTLIDGKEIGSLYFEFKCKQPELIEGVREGLTGALTHLGRITSDYSKSSGSLKIVAAEVGAFGSGAPGIAPNETDREALGEFLDWFNDNSVLLGSTAWKPSGSDGGLKMERSTGIYTSPPPYCDALVEDLERDVRKAISKGLPYYVTSISHLSPIGSRTPPLHIVIPRFDLSGNLLEVNSFLGYPSIHGAQEPSSNVPLLGDMFREQLKNNPLEQYEVRELRHVFDNMPKEIALTLSGIRPDRDLSEILSCSLSSKEKPAVSIHRDNSGRFHIVGVVTPNYSQNTDIVCNDLRHFFEDYLKAMPGTSLASASDNTGGRSRRYFFRIPASSGDEFKPLSDQEHEALRAQIADIVRPFAEKVGRRYEEVTGKPFPAEKYDTALKQFDKNQIPVDRAVDDLVRAEALCAGAPIRVEFEYSDPENKKGLTFVLYSLGERAPISHVNPVFANLGVALDREQSVVEVRANGDPARFVQRLTIKERDQDNHTQLDPNQFAQVIAPGLAQVLEGKAPSDRLNSLMMTAELSLRNIEMLRTYATMLWRMTAISEDKPPMSKVASLESVFDALASNPTLAQKLDKMFEVKHNPDSEVSDQERLQTFAGLKDDYLKSVKKLGTSRQSLEVMVDLIESTSRTNFFQNREDFAVDIMGKNLPMLKQPRPWCLSYVRAPCLEAVQIRHGEYSRGGQRAGENVETIFFEVFDLARTQDGKNAVIGLRGSKTDFAVTGEMTAQQRKGAVLDACCRMNESLTSLRDNLQIVGFDEEKKRWICEVKHPERLVRYRADKRGSPQPGGVDWYAPVGPDVGTGGAEFTQAVNGRIAATGHILGRADCYMSSFVYPHAPLQITSRGTVMRLKHDLQMLGIDPLEDLRLIGVGDPRGDVFGGFCKAASEMVPNKVVFPFVFNHLNIVFNPNGDPAAMQAEQLRLQRESKSWEHYDPSVLGLAGAIFGRNDPEISLTPEMRAALNSEDPDSVPQVMSGADLARRCITIKADGIYAGGIKTYICASSEDPDKIEGAPDDGVIVRVTELNVRFIIEGANLFMTPAARKECHDQSIRVISASVDNSAGVNISRLETDYELLLYPYEAVGQMTRDERLARVKEATPFAVNKALDAVRKHCIMIEQATAESPRRLEIYDLLIGDLERRGLLDRDGSGLPTREELNVRFSHHKGLAPSEIAQIFPGVKTIIFEELAASDLVNHEYLGRYLHDYFPKTISAELPDAVDAHLLRKNIIAGEIANYIVDNLGPTIVHELYTGNNVSETVAVKFILAADMILDARTTREFINENQANLASPDDFSALLLELADAEETLASWLVRLYGQPRLREKLKDPAPKSLDRVVDDLIPPYTRLVGQAESVLSQEEMKEVDTLRVRYTGMLSPLKRVNPDEYERGVGLLNNLAALKHVEALFENIHMERRVVDRLQKKGLEVSGFNPATLRQAREEVLGLLDLSDLPRLAETVDYSMWQDNQALVQAQGEMRQRLGYMVRACAFVYTWREGKDSMHSVVQEVFEGINLRDTLSRALKEIRETRPQDRKPSLFNSVSLILSGLSTPVEQRAEALSSE